MAEMGEFERRKKISVKRTSTALRQDARGVRQVSLLLPGRDIFHSPKVWPGFLRSRSAYDAVMVLIAIATAITTITRSGHKGGRRWSFSPREGVTPPQPETRTVVSRRDLVRSSSSTISAPLYGGMEIKSKRLTRVLLFRRALEERPNYNNQMTALTIMNNDGISITPRRLPCMYSYVAARLPMPLQPRPRPCPTLRDLRLAQ